MAAIHHWTFEEDYICCEEFVTVYVLQKSNMPLSDFVRLLSTKMPELKHGALRLKIQNIKQLAIEFEVENSLKASPRVNYSAQNHEAFIKVIHQYLAEQ